MTTKKTKSELLAYCTDASMIEGNASGIIFPESKEDVQKMVRANSSITIRGGGTGLVGGAVPQNSIVLDLSKMNKILDFGLARKIIEVEPGIILDELNEFLEKYNLEFPVKPSSHSVCTIGGMIATNAVGNRAIKYGKTSNWLESIEVVDGNGNLAKINKPDLSDFTGMEGITGIVVKAKLKLSEKKERTASMLKLNTLDEVVAVSNKLKLMNEVSALEFLDKFSSSLLGLEEFYHLIIEFESRRGELREKEYEELMKKRDSLYPVLASAGYTHIEDPKILLVRFRELAEFLEKEGVPFYGHLGVGIIHPVFKQEEKDKIEKMLKFVKRLHGQVTGEHGVGLTKKEFLDATDKKIIERVKKRHDPLLKLNLGKVVDMKDKLSQKIIKEKELAEKEENPKETGNNEEQKIKFNENIEELFIQEKISDAEQNPEKDKGANAEIKEENKNA